MSERGGTPSSLGDALGAMGIPTRAARAAEDARKGEELAGKLADMMRRVLPPDEAREVVDDLEAGRTERERAASGRADALYLSAHHGERLHNPPEIGSAPQHAKPPQHFTTYNQRREDEALKVAQKQANKHGRRDPVYWPAWARELARRVCEAKGRALSELSALPGWARDSVLREARPYGGADSVRGRNVIALSIVCWHVGGRLKGRISGLPRSAYTSLTVGANGQHYSDSAVWHPVHDMQGELLEDVRGPEGGRIGAGKNRGFMRAVLLAGWMRTIVPASYGLPGWMIASSGWPFIQVIVQQTPPDSS